MATRVLGIVVKAQGAAAAAQQVGRVDRAVSGVSRRAGTFAATLNKKVGGALGTFSGRLRGFATAGLGLFGIGGLFALGSAFTNSIAKAREFGEASQQLARITGQSVEQTSRMVDALDFYGIAADKANKIAGMSVKNAANLGADTKKAKKFQDDFGLSILDGSGNVRKFNDQLLVSADYFNNKSIPASKKAAALSKLYGRSWQDLLPVLAKGRSGIEQALKDAMSLSQADLDAIVANKQATREWDDAVGDLQTRIGIDLLPTLTELAQTFTGFVKDNGPQIRDFFKNAVEGGKKFASGAAQVIGGIQSVWNSIPEPVRDLLVKGLIADRTVKFLFGFSITGLVGSITTGVAGGVAKAVAGSLVGAGLGKAFVQPVFVTNKGFGVGGPGGAAGAKGGIGALGMFGAFALPAAVAAGTGFLAEEGNKHPERTRLGIGEMRATTGLDFAAFQNLVTALDALPKVLNDIKNPPNPLRIDPRNLSEGNREIVDKVTRSRDATESMRIALNTKLGETRGAIVAAAHSDTDRIVAAINRNGAPKVNVFVDKGDSGRRPGQTGGTLNRQRDERANGSGGLGGT